MTYRRRFRASLLTALAGGVLACYAMSPFPRAAALLLLVLAGAQLAVSVRDLRRHRHGKSYLRHAALVYGPHVGVALLLAAALRLWLVLAPPAPTALATLPPEALRARLGHDAARLLQWRTEGTNLIARLDAAAGRAAVDPDALRAAWEECLALARRYEEMLLVYQGFHHVDAVGQQRLHADAFVIGLAAHAQRLLLLSAAVERVEAAEAARALPDKPRTRWGGESCRRTRRKLLSDRNLLRLHAGTAYLSLVRENCSPDQLLLRRLDGDLAAARQRFGATTLKALRDPLLQLRRLARRPVWERVRL
jgi:hypothetical protein